MLNRRTLVFTYKRKDSSSEVKFALNGWGKECGTKERQSNRRRKLTNVGYEKRWRKKEKTRRGKFEERIC